MTPEQFAQINITIKETIQTTVNGKVDGLRRELQEYIERDNDWKENVTPSIEIMKKMQGFASVGGFVLKGMILIGASATAVWSFIKFVIHK